MARPVSGVSVHGETRAPSVGAMSSTSPSPSRSAACAPMSAVSHPGGGAVRGGSARGVPALVVGEPVAVPVGVPVVAGLGGPGVPAGPRAVAAGGGGAA